MKNVLLIIGLFLLWRLFLFLPLLYAEHHIPPQKDSLQYTLWAYARPYTPVSSFLLYPWSNFDGVHYLTIAGDGGFLQPLGYQEGSDGRFFPLYPFLISATTFLVGHASVFDAKVFFSAFFVSNLFFLLSLILLFKLVQRDFSTKTALWTLVLLVCFPVSFFFGATYSESVFLFLSLATFYLLQKKLFLLAALSAFLLVLTRVVGVVIIPIVLYEMWRDDYALFFQKKIRLPLTQTIGKLFFSFLIPSGILLFSFYSWYMWRDPLFFIHAQQHVGDGRSLGIILFPQTLFRYSKILLTLPRFSLAWNIAALELFSFVFAGILLYVAYKKHVSKGYTLFSLFMLLIASENGTFSGLPRYIMVLFPVFIGFALLKNSYIKIIYILLGLLSLFFLTAFFAQGYFIA